MLPKQTYKKVIKNASLKHQDPGKQKNGLIGSEEDLDKSPKNRKSKLLHTTNKDKGTVHKEKTEHKKKHKDHKRRSEESVAANDDDINLMGTPVKTKLTKASKSGSSKEKSKKEKKPTKDKKYTKNNSLLNEGSKSGYEEALGISTPTKEVY